MLWLLFTCRALLRIDFNYEAALIIHALFKLSKTSHVQETLAAAILQNSLTQSFLPQMIV